MGPSLTLRSSLEQTWSRTYIPIFKHLSQVILKMTIFNILLSFNAMNQGSPGAGSHNLIKEKLIN